MVTTVKTHNRIKEVREAKGLSQTELGRLVGLSEPAINRYERGNRKPSRRKLDDIAKALDVPLKSLFINLSRCEDDMETEDFQGEVDGRVRAGSKNVGAAISRR